MVLGCYPQLDVNAHAAVFASARRSISEMATLRPDGFCDARLSGRVLSVNLHNRSAKAERSHLLRQRTREIGSGQNPD
jgi:hypothetical protein